MMYDVLVYIKLWAGKCWGEIWEASKVFCIRFYVYINPFESCLLLNPVLKQGKIMKFHAISKLLLKKALFHFLSMFALQNIAVSWEKKKRVQVPSYVFFSTQPFDLICLYCFQSAPIGTLETGISVLLAFKTTFLHLSNLVCTDIAEQSLVLCVSVSFWVFC